MAHFQLSMSLTELVSSDAHYKHCQHQDGAFRIRRLWIRNYTPSFTSQIFRSKYGMCQNTHAVDQPRSKPPSLFKTSKRSTVMGCGPAPGVSRRQLAVEFEFDHHFHPFFRLLKPRFVASDVSTDQLCLP